MPDPMADGAICIARVGDITSKEDGAEYGRARIEVGTSSDTPIFTWEDPAQNKTSCSLLYWGKVVVCPHVSKSR